MATAQVQQVSEGDSVYCGSLEAQARFVKSEAINSISKQPMAEQNERKNSGDVAGQDKEDETESRPSKKYVDEDSMSPEYRTDEWRMKHFKVVPCSKRYAHDWTICPFAHPGEKARRRDPELHQYAGIACPDMKKAGFCSRGETCPYAHNVFEYWMHPTRYRTQLCNDGTSCTRHVCFFAHTPEEMRASPLTKPLVISDKKDDENEDVSPDTPFMVHAFSLNTGSSTTSIGQASRQASQNLPTLYHNDGNNMQNHSPPSQNGTTGLHAGNRNKSMDALLGNLANLKVAMGGEKRGEVINMLSNLLKESSVDNVEGLLRNKVDQSSHRQNIPLPASGPNAHQASVLQAIQALDYNDAQTLLNLARAQVQQQNARDHATEHQQRMYEQLLEANQMQLQNSAMRRSSASESVFSAPGGLDYQVARHASSGGLNLGEFQTSPSEVPSAMMSGDLGYAAVYRANSQGGYRQNSAGAPEMMRAPNSKFIRRMSSTDHTQYGAYGNPLDKAGLYATNSFSSASGSANPGALKSQSFSLDDVGSQSMMTPQQMSQQMSQQQMGPSVSQPPRPVRQTPVPSAFQPMASQEWKTAPGRNVQTDLSWQHSNTLSCASGDLRTISENQIPGPRDFHPIDVGRQYVELQDSRLNALQNRSKSTGVGRLNYEPNQNNFNLLQTPLSMPPKPPSGGPPTGGKEPNALHSAPYDLRLAYAAELSNTHGLQNSFSLNWAG